MGCKSPRVGHCDARTPRSVRYVRTRPVLLPSPGVYGRIFCPHGWWLCGLFCLALFLPRKAAPALPEDLPIAQDLLETLIAHKDGCVGMAANMIGVAKRIIAFESEDGYLIMFNPVILKKSGPYETEEGCLSLTGTRKTKRFQTIKVQWQNEKFQPRIKTFSGWTAEIIQHELDHCDGILI